MVRIRKPKPDHPSFFKVLVGDFSTKLKVPIAFEKNLKLKKNLPTTFKISLRSAAIARAISWNVKLGIKSSVDNGRYCLFSKGWRKLVKDMNLAEGDFLVFHLKAEDEFEVEVYAPTCCQKKIPFLDSISNGTVTQGERQRVKVKEEINDDGEGKDREETRPCYEKTLANHQIKFFSLPNSFIRETGLCDTKEVVIRNQHGNNWHVVMKERTKNYLRYDLVTGWSDFLKGNGFVVGDTLKFEFVKGCIIEVKVMSRA